MGNNSAGNSKATRDVAVQDQSTEILDLLLTAKIDDITLPDAVVKDQRAFDVITTGSVPLVGEIICLKDVDGISFYQAEIIVVVFVAGDRYTVEMDSPLDAAFETTDGCSLRTKDLSTANGSVTPVEFVVSPDGLDPETEWDITRMIVTISGTGAMDDGLFGDQASLTRGLLFRHVNGTTKNIFNAKSNGDFSKHCYDRDYAARAPAGQTTVSVRRSFNGFDKNGVVIRLKATDLDRFVGLVQDDLTGILSVEIVVQGHLVEKD